jgi:hypothetical protein
VWLNAFYQAFPGNNLSRDPADAQIQYKMYVWP